MLQNYFKIAWRNMTRHLTQTAINVIGLTLGMTCCLFIFLWVKYEKGIDNFHAQGGNIYSVYQTVTTNGKTDGSYSTPLKIVTGQNYPSFLLEDVSTAVPQVKYQVYYATGYELPWGHPETFQFQEKKLKLEGSRAGKDFFKVFSYPLIAGNPETALNNMKGIAISRKMAEAFFGTPQNAMGKSLRYENSQNFTVSAVFENLPLESSLQFDFLFNWDAQKKLLEWSSNDFQSYVELVPNADATGVEASINRFIQPRLEKNNAVEIHVGLQKFSDKYLHGNFVNGKPLSGRIEYIRIFSSVAIFILFIACINFMNLATARSVKRAKEVGLRKVVGSSRGQLIWQFFAESIAFSFIAMVLSIILVIYLLPSFNQFTNKHIELQLTSPSLWFSLIMLMLFTGLIAGSYPALYLSSLKPIRILKGVTRFTQGSILFRKGLTVFQFMISIILLVATIVITRQINFVQNTNLGYDRENLIYTRIEGELANQNKYLLFKNQVSHMPGIGMVDRSSEAPHAMDFVVTDAVNWEGKNKNADVGFKPASVGFDFVKLMNLKIAKGRDFSREISSDSSDAFLVNEEAVKEMGMKNPIGKWVSAWKKKGHIIGILKDYHTHSLREPIKPVILDVKEYEYFGVIIVRTFPGKTKDALSSLEKVYKVINPNYPFAYQFVDEEYKNLYSNELIISKLSIIFASLAILISCLGLLGLVMFSAEQRTKEIGIRKVLGASMGSIVGLFSKDFLKLIFIAFLIAVPLAWYSMNHWLQDFAYKIDLSWWIFALAAGISILITLITVSQQAIKAAVANPVTSLRSE
ncbi:MAG TPA: FtsX-like permease family protein [Puia sp.]|jgi:putative ABC transport system permease protein|nr:FtsX-like permease family protein [Puia sp.]